MNQKDFFIRLDLYLIAFIIGIGPIKAETVIVPEPPKYSYESWSVLQLKVRGEYGRYLSFIGTSPNEYKGTSGYYDPGSPGSISCSSFGTYTTTTSCRNIGYRAPSYVPGSPSGIQKGKFRYELDCQDRTFDRKGDISAGAFKKGWMPVSSDPVAKAVAQKYCPIIDSLYKEPTKGDPGTI